MHISILLMEQIIELFIMILMGFIIVKAGIVKDEDSKVLSKIVLYLIIPCVIINAFQVDYTSKTVRGLLIAFAASVILQLVLLFIISAMGRLFHMYEGEVAAVYYSNSGNLIVPIVTFILGREWVLYGCAFMSVQLVFLWTHCKKIISRESSYDWRKIVLNINMISIVIGVVLFFTRIHLPQIINDTIGSVGSMIGPASMIVTGMLFAGMELKKDFANRKGKWKVVFRKHSRKQGTVSVTKDAYKISWALENAEKVKAEETGTNAVLYPDILPGTDSRFCVRGKSIKEDIILKTPEAIGSFTWLYHTKKLHPVAGNSCVRFVNDAEEEIFAVAAPFMTASAGKRSENIGIELLDEGKKDRCAIRITPDEEWLKDPERVYPVIVDPITTTSKDVKEIIDACVDSQDAAGTDREGMYLKTRGGDIIQRSYLKFKLPMIKTGDMVINARMLMVSLAKDGKERTVQVHRVLQDWDSAYLTWMNKPMYSESVEDICKFTGDEQKYISLDITRLV